jgi:hypothetical protein
MSIKVETKIQLDLHITKCTDQNEPHITKVWIKYQLEPYVTKARIKMQLEAHIARSADQNIFSWTPRYMILKIQSQFEMCQISAKLSNGKERCTRLSNYVFTSPTLFTECMI